jgi:hypothetical protein
MEVTGFAGGLDLGCKRWRGVREASGVVEMEE